MRITNLMGLTKAMKNRVPMAPKVLHIVYGKIICFVKFYTYLFRKSREGYVSVFFAQENLIFFFGLQYIRDILNVQSSKLYPGNCCLVYHSFSK